MNPNRERMIALQTRLTDQLEHRLMQSSIADTVSCTLATAIKEIGYAVEACGMRLTAYSGTKIVSENGKAH